MSRGSFRLATLGCRTNQYETQLYRDQLLQLGFREAAEGEAADLCIVNTCMVTGAAAAASRREVRQLVRHNPTAKVIVTGCLASRPVDAVDQIPGVALVVPNAEKAALIPTLFPEAGPVAPFITHFEGHTRAFLKVQDGCNSFCTYCIIPYVRGRSRSRTLSSVLEEVTGLLQKGYRDIVLTGINLGDFRDGERGLADLLREVDSLEGVERVRLSSIDPEQVDAHLIEAMAESRHFAPHLHLSIQSGSDLVLQRMNRHYTRAYLLSLIERLRKALPEILFTTDIIVGFPGESEEDFAETLDLLGRLPLSKVHLFPYSRREGTRAARYPDLPPQLVEERMERALRATEEHAYQLRAGYVGRKVAVLMEGGGRGHTDTFLPVFVPHYGGAVNQMVQVKIVANRAEGLEGVVDD